MPVRKGLTQLYDAKTMMMESLSKQVRENRFNNVNDTLAGREIQLERETYKPLYRSGMIMPCEELWLAVIEQAIFDAHLHATGGNYQSVIWVKDARDYFTTRDFEWICDQLGLESDWVRSLIQSVERLARRLRGTEYDEAIASKGTRNNVRGQS